MEQATVNPIFNFLPIIFIVFIFYFLVFRPQKDKQTQHSKMVSGLKKNDRVVTAGGIHGVVVGVKDTTVTVRIDDNVKIELQKDCVSSVKKSEDKD